MVFEKNKLYYHIYENNDMHNGILEREELFVIYTNKKSYLFVGSTDVFLNIFSNINGLENYLRKYGYNFDIFEIADIKERTKFFNGLFSNIPIYMYD
jgi:hypothetical protein